MRRICEEDLEHILSHTADVWEGIRNKLIFITGATGFFGKWLLESFVYINKKLGLNAIVYALSRDPESFLAQFPFYKNEPSVFFLKGNILDFEFPETSFDFIIHAATDADAKLNSERPLLMLDTITEGTRRILEFAKDQPLQSLLFTSSGAVYGKQPETVTHVKETESFHVDINDSRSAYAEGKRLAELYCSIYYSHYSLPVKIARCFAFVGPYLPLDKHFAIGNFILNALQGQDIIIKGDGTPYRSYLYAADLTVWLWKILLQGENNTPYNVGSNEDFDLKTVATTVAELTPNIQVQVLTTRDDSKPVERYVPDVSFAKKKLGVEVSFNLVDSIKRTKDFYTSNETV